ncbi:transposable element Tcb1 transposase [Trichonephila clavipes]|nr:transposable element Tcb1 transposase [Trichonephila clavipes]
MAWIVRHNDESVREGYIRNVGKEVKLFTSALKAFQCNNRIVMAQRKHLVVPVRQFKGRQTVNRRLRHIGLYVRRPVRCVPLTATHCHLRLTWSRGHSLWTPKQWSCVMFSDESRFSLQSDSRRTLIWRAPGTRYHQENTIERHRYGGAGWLTHLGKNYSWFQN